MKSSPSSPRGISGLTRRTMIIAGLHIQMVNCGQISDAAQVHSRQVTTCALAPRYAPPLVIRFRVRDIVCWLRSRSRMQDYHWLPKGMKCDVHPRHAGASAVARLPGTGLPWPVRPPARSGRKSWRPRQRRDKFSGFTRPWTVARPSVPGGRQAGQRRRRRRPPVSGGRRCSCSTSCSSRPRSPGSRAGPRRAGRGAARPR